MKKSIKILSLVAICTVLGVSTSKVVGISNGTASIANVFTSAKIKLSVQENGDENTEPTLEKTLTWEATDDGYTAQKEVKVANNSVDSGSISAWVRVCILPTLYTKTDISGETITLNVSNNMDFDGFGSLKDIKITDSQYTMGNVTFHLNENWNEYWTFNPDDGYFYYNTALAPDTSTVLLLKKVSITSEFYEKLSSNGVNLQIDILSDSKQSQFDITSTS